MATLNKYIFDLKEILRNHHIVDEDYLTNRLLEFWIISQRSLWLKRRDRAFIHTDQANMQSLITEMFSVDRSFIPDLVPATYKILRSENKLPKLINFESWDGIISAGSIDMASQRFNHVTYEEAMRSGFGRFNRNQIHSFLSDGYLYTTARNNTNYWQLISQASITGIFEDPREVANFKHIDGTACWTEDDDYPISLELWDYMKTEIVKANIDLLYKVPVDKSNDDNSSNNDTP